MAKIEYHSQAAQDAANRVIEAFEDPTTLPAKLAPVVLAAGGRHADRYSWRNQLIVALMGYSDAAGYKQWRSYGRQVRKGEKAMAILRPIKRSFNVTDTDPNTGQETERRITYVIGFTDVKVFGQETTDVVDEEKWKAFQGKGAEAQEKIEASPLYNVATTWGLKVKADGHLVKRGALGCYSPSEKELTLAVENAAVWAHELVHFADDALGNMTTRYGQQPDNEVVAQLGAAVLLTAMEMDHEADLGGSWEYVKHYSEDDDTKAIKACTTLLHRTLDAVAAILHQLADPNAPAPWADDTDSE